MSVERILRIFVYLIGILAGGASGSSALLQLTLWAASMPLSNALWLCAVIGGGLVGAACGVLLMHLIFFEDSD